MNTTTKAWLAASAMAVGVGAIALFGRRSRRGLGDARDVSDPRGVRAIAADAFIEGDLTRGKQILDQLPEEERTVARCVRARKRQYIKGTGWKGWKQASTYRLYAPFVAKPLYGDSTTHPYTSIDVVTEHIGADDGKVIISQYKNVDSVTIIGDMGATPKHANGETRFLVHTTQKQASHREALAAIGYDTVVPCTNVPLSGRRHRRSR